jgi:hypothetical protein
MTAKGFFDAFVLMFSLLTGWFYADLAKFIYYVKPLRNAFYNFSLDKNGLPDFTKGLWLVPPTAVILSSLYTIVIGFTLDPQRWDWLVFSLWFFVWCFLLMTVVELFWKIYSRKQRR